MIEKLCICGRSKALPYCDNSHTAENWSCAVEERWSDYGFTASKRYLNLAVKLAAHFGGELVSQGAASLRVDTLVTVIDGFDLSRLITSDTSRWARRHIIVTLGVEPGLLATPFPDHEIHSLDEVDIFQAFKRIERLLECSPMSSRPVEEALATCFLSHAVKDEPFIFPAVDYLRNFYGANLFLCADSIRPGEDWQKAILSALREREIFAAILSKSTLESHFVSFEIGVAYALKKSLVLLSLDGSYPPSFLQHLQVIDLPRLQRQRPWLSLQDILVDGLLKSLKVQPTGT